MIKACIFDLDGTLLYTLESIARAGNAVLACYGYPPEPAENYRYYCGDGADRLVARILTKAGDKNPSHYEEGCRINRRELKKEPLYGVRVYDGMAETLQELRRRGFRLGVCSNKPDAAAKEAIAGCYGGNLFDAVQGQETGLALKPSPDGPLKVAGLLGAKPEECLYLGDTGTDMKTGTRAGMHTVGVLWGYREKEELLDGGAQRLIERPSEILTLTGGFL